MNNKFTNDPVLVLLTKITTHYEMCKNSSVSFDKYNEYEVVSTILNIIKEISEEKKPQLKLVNKNES